MLIATRQFGPLSDSDIADATELEARHIRQQMKADVEGGIVSVDDEAGLYELTDEGRDLLKRFEAYRKENGKTLPKLPLERDEDKPERNLPVDDLLNGTSQHAYSQGEASMQ